MALFISISIQFSSHLCRGFIMIALNLKETGKKKTLQIGSFHLYHDMSFHVFMFLIILNNLIFVYRSCTVFINLFLSS